MTEKEHTPLIERGNLTFRCIEVQDQREYQIMSGSTVIAELSNAYNARRMTEFCNEHAALKAKVEEQAAEIERLKKFNDPEYAQGYAVSVRELMLEETKRAEELKSQNAAMKDRDAKLTKLVKEMIENDPNELVSDAGHSVLDVWRHEAKKILNQMEEDNEQS